MSSCLTTVEFVLTGASTGPYGFTFPMLPATTVAVTPQIEVYVGTTLLTLTTDYSVNESAKTITLVSNYLAGDVLSIRRTTLDSARYVDFTNGGVLAEQILDLDSDQLFFLIQENHCKILNSLSLLGDCWNGQGKQACNFAPGSNNTSLVTLGQVLNLLNGLGSVIVGSTHYVTAVGDGAETDFDYDAFGLPEALSTHDLFVTVDNIIQDSGAAYTSLEVGGVKLVRFAVAPVLNAVVTIRSLTGSVVASNLPGTMPGQNLIDGSVDVSKLFDTIDETFDGNGGVVILRASQANSGTLPATSLMETMVLTTDAIRDFDFATRRSFRLNEFVNAPDGAVNLNNNPIESLSMGTTPGAGTATNKGYVDVNIAAALAGNAQVFLEASAFESIEASVKGDGLPRTGTVLVPWGTHPGVLNIRILASYDAENTVYTPANEYNHTITHWEQSSNITNNPLGGDSLLDDGANGWLGSYTDPTGYKTLRIGNFAGYLVNTGGTDLYLWVNVTASQIEWELADINKVAIPSLANPEYFQIRMAFNRKVV